MGEPVLIVLEDDEAQRLAVTWELEKLSQEHGFRMEIADDGPPAQAIIEKLRAEGGDAPLLFLFDLNIPNGDGLSILEEAREAFGERATLVLFTSMAQWDGAPVHDRVSDPIQLQDKPMSLEATRDFLGSLVSKWMAA